MGAHAICCTRMIGVRSSTPSFLACCPPCPTQPLMSANPIRVQRHHVGAPVPPSQTHPQTRPQTARLLDVLRSIMLEYMRFRHSWFPGHTARPPQPSPAMYPRRLRALLLVSRSRRRQVGSDFDALGFIHHWYEPS